MLAGLTGLARGLHTYLAWPSPSHSRTSKQTPPGNGPGALLRVGSWRGLGFLIFALWALPVSLSLLPPWAEWPAVPRLPRWLRLPPWGLVPRFLLWRVALWLSSWPVSGPWWLLRALRWWSLGLPLVALPLVPSLSVGRPSPVGGAQCRRTRDTPPPPWVFRGWNPNPAQGMGGAVAGNNAGGPMLPPWGWCCYGEARGGGEAPPGDNDSKRTKCRVDVAFVEI